jgi:hypothetical protein
VRPPPARSHVAIRVGLKQDSPLGFSPGGCPGTEVKAEAHVGEQAGEQPAVSDISCVWRSAEGTMTFPVYFRLEGTDNLPLVGFRQGYRYLLIRLRTCARTPGKTCPTPWRCGR